jgi:WD40 repeat protein
MFREVRWLTSFLLLISLPGGALAIQPGPARDGAEKAAAKAERWEARGRKDVAREYLGRSHTLAELGRDAVGGARGHRRLGAFAARRGRCEAALTWYAAAQRDYQRALGRPRPWPEDRWLAFGQDLDQELWLEYEGLAVDVGRAAGEARAWGRAVSARSMVAAARRVRLGPRAVELGWALVARGEAEAVLGDAPAAGRSYREALDILQGRASVRALEPVRRALALLAATAGSPRAQLPTQANLAGDVLTLPHDSPAELVHWLGPDRLMTASQETRGYLHVWDLPSATRIRSLPGVPVLGHLLSVPGRPWLVGARPAGVWRYDLSRGAALPSLSSRRLGLGRPALAVSPNGLLVAAGGSPRAAGPTGEGGPAEVVLWRLEKGRLYDRRRWRDPGRVRALAFAPSARLMAAGSEGGVIRLRDLRRGDLSRRLEGHQGAVTALAFLERDRYLVSAGADGAVNLWDVFRGHLIRSMRGHEGPVTALDVEVAGWTAVSGGADGKVVVWNLADGSQRHSLGGTGAAVAAVRLSPSGDRVASAHADRRVTVWRLLGELVE